MIKYDLYLGADFIHISVVTLLSSGKYYYYLFLKHKQCSTIFTVIPGIKEINLF